MKNRIGSLESLRGIFCFIIVFGIHYDWIFTGGYGLRFPFQDILYPIQKYGFYGVEFFFMLSGFGIANSYKKRIMNGKVNFKDYIGSRIKKIYPIMLVTLLVTVIGSGVYKCLTGMYFYAKDLSFFSILLSALGMSSGWFYNDVNINLPVWYMSSLMLLYIIYFYVAHASKKNNFKYLTLCALLVVLGWSFLATPVKFAFTFENISRGYLCFFLGCLLKEANDCIQLNAKKVISGVSLLISLVLFILTIKFGQEEVLGSLRMTLILFVFPNLILAAINLRPMGKILEWRPLIFLGKISTDLYFWHFPAFMLIRILAIYCPIQQFYSTGWFYFLIIIYGVLVGILSHSIFNSQKFKCFVDHLGEKIFINEKNES